jgi:RNA polymerase sigma-70 factor, ECF subfamily
MANHPDNEDSIVAAACAGDSEAFVTLSTHYSSRVYRLALSITGTHQDAEDVLQEAMMRAYVNLAGFRGNSRFYTWLARIATNVALNKLRKSARWNEQSLDEPREGLDSSYLPIEIEDWGDDPEEAYLKSELQTLLSQSILELDPKSRTVFTLRDVEKFSTEETAEILDVSISVVKTRLLRSRLKLREGLTKYFRKDARHAMPGSH